MDQLHTLPDDVLIPILRFVAGAPVCGNRSPPFPIVASRLNRRIRAVTLTCPELWSTIRFSHNPRSWTWAALFVRRSGSHLLDMSINLETFTPQLGIDAPIPLHRALVIIGPHIERWRTFSLRCWAHQVGELYSFMVRSPKAAQLQSAHISLVDYWHLSSYHPLAPVFCSPTFHALRVDIPLDDLRAFPSLRTFDVDFAESAFWHYAILFRENLGPDSSLRTLIMRNFPHVCYPGAIEAAVITSIAVSFRSTHDHIANFKSLMNTFNFPNLEYLEIVGPVTTAFTASSTDMAGKAEWDPCPFPNLRTLRLEEVAFIAVELAAIQSLSRGITALELIYTTGNHHLLQHAWPALRSLTVYTQLGDARWLPRFLVMRPSVTLILPPWLLHSVALTRVSSPATKSHREIRFLQDGVTRALIDGVCNGQNFFFDEYTMRSEDFGPVLRPDPGPKFDFAGTPNRMPYWAQLEELDWFGESNIAGDMEQTERAIEEAFQARGEVARAKGMGRELRKQTRRESKDGGTMVKAKWKCRKRRYTCVAEDFVLVRHFQL
ncbi:hypothetical protein C8R45DRAFT_1099544 [Mycena sanguinolenta]|nr:hypothetical protein C8R45DRAFT_1099544 [Mycena sanguinolenta]